MHRSGWHMRSIASLGWAVMLWGAGIALGAPAEPLPQALHPQVLALGPWPPPWRPDPNNPRSGDRQAVELGRLLFRDPRMSPIGYIACVSCHQPDRAFTDTRARAHGLADLPRNTPTLANLRLQRWYGWGGASDSLWLASIRPILDAREFDGSVQTVARLFARDADLAACYRAVFGGSAQASPKRTLVNVGQALAAYVETLTTGRTPFDDFRDALERGGDGAEVTYPAAARRGLAAFVGEAGCVACHGGPNFSDGGFHTGAAPPHPGAPGGGVRAVDGGRWDDLRRLRHPPPKLRAVVDLAPQRGQATPSDAPRADEALRGQFRTPSLRNVGVTAPYLHDGRAQTLREAVQHASPARPLSPEQLDDLVAFLQTLTDAAGARRPWTPSEVDTRCH